MLNRHPVIACILSLALVAYACFALHATSAAAADDTLRACLIEVTDTASTGFVTPAEVSQEGGGLYSWAERKRLGDIDLYALEKRLRACDKIESVNVYMLNNGTLKVDVTPMQPVARVFDGRNSYYINAGGKRISADPRFHVDVPVVVGHFTPDRPATRLLPLLDYIASRTDLDALVSTVKQEADGDIVIVPTIRGHVVNFGDTADTVDKFARLLTFYRRVMPVAGWETYDTVAVKWRGQVVASRRDKALGESHLSANTEEFEDIDDTDTMISPLHTDSAKTHTDKKS